MFKLTEEQVQEIVESYGGSKNTILLVEDKLNALNNNLSLLNDEDDYFEIIAAVVSQLQTIKNKISHSNLNQKKQEYVTINELLRYELIEKYGPDKFEEEDPQKMI